MERAGSEKWRIREGIWESNMELQHNWHCSCVKFMNVNYA